LNFTSEIISGQRYSRQDMAAALMVCAVLVVAVLFPENFISGLPLIGTQRSYPLTLMLPFIAVFSAAYIVASQRLLRPRKVDALVLLFFIFLLARNVVGPETLATGKYVIYGLGVYYVTSLVVARRASSVWLIIYTIVGLIAVTAIYGLVEYAFQENLIYHQYVSQSVPEPRVGLHRLASFLAHPVPYGAFLIQAMPFSMLAWYMGSSSKIRVVAMAATLLGVIALFFTYSKGSWIVATMLALGSLFLIPAGRTRKFALPAVIIAGILALTAVIFWQQIRSEIEARANTSIDIRLSSWDGAVEGIRKNPVFGVGLKQGGEELKNYVDPLFYEGLGTSLPVDNYYLNLILEEGLVGFLIWAIMLALIIFEGIKVMRARGPGGPWALAAFASLVGICFNSITFESMHIWPNFVIFWMAAGFLHGIAWGNAPAAEKAAGRTVAA